MGSAEGHITRLGALEQRVMDVLWDCGSSNIKGIIAQLDNDPAYTTISTIVTNLERKGLVTSHRAGRTVIYKPVHSREVHAAELMEQALSTSNDRAASILHFIDSIEPNEVQLLRNYLKTTSDTDRHGAGRPAATHNRSDHSSGDDAS